MTGGDYVLLDLRDKETVLNKLDKLKERYTNEV